jgi:hypothetical protein
LAGGLKFVLPVWCQFHPVNTRAKPSMTAWS